LNLFSVRTRFFVSVITNIFRAGITFVSGILVARGLSPVGYGDLTFLLGSFVAIRSLLDMGSSSAFYTLLSQRARGRRFYLFYFAWLALQFVVTLLLIALIMPSGMFEKIWLGHSRGIVVLAFLAAFMQQQVWQMIGQIGEAARKTVKVQLLNSAVAITYLTVVWLILVYGRMSVELMLQLLIMQYAGAAILASWLLRETQVKPVETEDTLKQMAGAFWVYCRPLIGLYAVGFLYAFAGKWMLQKFGGAAQQGYFQVASQFAQVSLLATVSILNIFWKEIAEATAKGDHARVARLYQKINRGLVMLSTIITGLLLPWSKQIVAILLGPAYEAAWPVLAVMFLYPIHQSMGQIGGTMFLASGDTRKYVILSIAIMLVFLPFSYFVMAPTSGTLIPGLGLGAIGMACYMVFSNIFGVNVQAWVIARNAGWKYDWSYQAVGIPLMLGLGYLVKAMSGMLWNLDGVGIVKLRMPIVFACFVYAFSVLLLVWRLPWIIGMEREGIHAFLKNLLRREKLLE
jgi:O-antigen/teichoic acid export membrane protein